MSCRFTADNQNLSRTTGLFSSANMSFCCWARIAVDLNRESVLFDIATATPTSALIATSSDGVTMQMTDNSTFVTDLGVMTVGSWYFIAVTKSGVDFVGYISPAGGGTLTKVTGTSSSTYTGNWATFRIALEEFTPTTFINGNIQSFKFWNAVLTQAELELEMWQQHVVRTAGLNAFYPLFGVTNDTKDLSGNGNDLTAGAGTPATEAGPPVAWLI